MSPLERIYAVGVALYLLECFTIARSSAIVFAQRKLNGEWQLLQGLALEGLHGRLYFGSLLPFHSIVMPRWPETAGESSFDFHEAQFRFNAFRMRSRSLGFLCSAMTLHLLVLTPIVISLLGWRRTWLVAASILVALSIAIVFDARDITREFAGPECVDFALLAPLLLSPLAASRAVAAVSGACFRPFHPLVLYGVLCPGDRCRAFAGGMLAAADRGDFELDAQEVMCLREFMN